MGDIAPAPDSPEFPTWLRDRRLARGISQENLGRSLGLGRKAVGRWEAGGGISASSYLRMVAALGADPPADSVPPDLTARMASVEAQLQSIAAAMRDLQVLVLFWWLFIFWRLFRRGNRNRRAIEARHRETLAAIERQAAPPPPRYDPYTGEPLGPRVSPPTPEKRVGELEERNG